MVSAGGLIAGVADAAHRWFNDRFCQTLVVANSDVLPTHCPAIGHRRHHAHIEPENGRVSSADVPREKWQGLL